MTPKYIKGDVVVVCGRNEYGDRTVYDRSIEQFEPVDGFARQSFTIDESIFIEGENQWYYKKVDELYIAEICLTLDFLQTAKKRYPVGTIFEPAHVRGGYCVVTCDSYDISPGGHVYAKTREGFYNSENISEGNCIKQRVLYEKDSKRWAKILSKDVILEHAKKEYPVGSVFKCIHRTGSIEIKEAHTFKFDFDGCIRIYGPSVACLYSHDSFKWAEKVERSEEPSSQPSKKPEQMKSSKFKIGDIVVGNDLANGNYGVTTKGWRGVVINVNSNGYFTAHNYRDKHSVFSNLHQDHFDLFVSPSSTISKFKIGDIVVGNHDNRYVITRKGWVGEVISIDESGETMCVKETDGTETPYPYEVEQKYFDLYETSKEHEYKEKSFKFKVGDKVISNKKADERYSVTQNGWIGEVIEVTNDYFRAKGSSGVDFTLVYECFDHYTPESSHPITPDQCYQPIIEEPKEEGDIIVLPLQKAIIF